MKPSTIVATSLIIVCKNLYTVTSCDKTNMHYENMSMQSTVIFHGCKNDNFQMKNCNIFHIFAQNIDCGYTLEQVPTIYVLEQKLEKCIPLLTQVLLYKSGV